METLFAPASCRRSWNFVSLHSSQSYSCARLESRHHPSLVHSHPPLPSHTYLQKIKMHSFRRSSPSKLSKIPSDLHNVWTNRNGLHSHHQSNGIAPSPSDGKGRRRNPRPRTYSFPRLL